MQLSEDITSLRKDIDMETDCQIPCNEIKLEIMKTTQQISSWSKHWMQVHFVDTVDILEEESNYDGLDLVVEIGSCMGLWIGLSALGILDLAYGYVKIAYSKVSKNMIMLDIK